MNEMLKDIIYVQPLEDYRLHVRFEDGIEGVIDLVNLVKFSGVFGPLRDRQYFLQVSVNPDLGTICWPNGADLDPDVLYAIVTDQSVKLSGPALALAA